MAIHNKSNFRETKTPMWKRPNHSLKTKVSIDKLNLKSNIHEDRFLFLQKWRERERERERGEKKI